MISLRSFHALFRRYDALHRQLPLLPRKIRASDGHLLARIEREAIRGNMHMVEGWTLGNQISVSTPDRPTMTIAPFLPRADVQSHHGGPLHSGFEFKIPVSRGRSTITFSSDDQTVVRRLRRPWRIYSAIESVRLAICILWAGLRGAGAIRTYLHSDNMQDRDIAKQRLKQLLRLGRIAQRDHLVVSQNLGLVDAVDTGAPSPVTIVLPVYNAYDLVSECLRRVAAHTEGDWHLIIVEDHSTDVRVRPMVHEWAARQAPGRVQVLENEHNLGFIGSVNRGFAEAAGRGAPVVLLNSDALVPAGWVGRLLAPLVAADVASATPMSNDAEIMNVPVICMRGALEEGQGDRLDSIAQELLAGAPPVNLPTGVGFCMAIAPTWLERLPQFDTLFGRGYGEEVDWCRKATALGARHTGVPGLFVEHRGGQSFGPEKAELVAANGRIITERYPRYDAEVQEFIASDPLIGPRMVLALAAAAMLRDEVPVYLCHSLGGGAEDAMMRQLQDDLESGLPSVVLRVGGRFRYGVELHMPQGVTRASVEDEQVLAHLWRALPQIHMIYVCGVGDLDASSLPDRMIRWTDRPGARLSIELHDFFPLTPAYTLLDEAGQFTGPPHPDTHTGQVHCCRGRDGLMVGLAEWQRRWLSALRQADRVVVFSEHSRDLVLSIWPDLAGQVEVRPHSPLHRVPSVERPGRVPAKVIGVLGNIGRQKGAEVLSHLSHRMSQARGESLVLIGNIDPTYVLSPAGVVHGSYARENIAILAQDYAIDCWLIPSIWPETFSFTTHEALATGLPVWCFDLGAQAEAVRAAGQGAHVLPLPLHGGDTDAIVQRILGHGGAI